MLTLNYCPFLPAAYCPLLSILLLFRSMKLLIIRFSSIGDIVLTSPVVRCLKQQVPGAEIHFLTKYSMRHTVAANPYISKLHLLDESLHAIIEQLKAEHFDYLIDLHNNLRTWRIKRALKKVPAFSFDKLNWEKWLLTTFKINRLPPVHVVDRYLATVAALGVQNDGAGLDYFIPKGEETKPADIPAGHQLGYIGIVIGATYATKRLPVNKLQELCNSISYPIILLGGPEDKAVGEQLARANTEGRVYNACGKFTLNESASLVRNAKVIISHDTGLMHIAAAFKKPIVSIWGNTVPAFGMVPYYGERYEKKQMQSYEIFEVNGLSCRPCSKLGYAKCPRGHFKCMNDQDIQAIARKALEKLLR